MDRPADKLELHFEDQGSLPRPGLVGRVVRLVFGTMLLYGLFSMVTDGLGLFSSTVAPRSLDFWVFVAIAFHLTPYVINIGFGRRWRRRPQLVIAVLVLLLIAADFVLYGTWWAPPLGAFMWLWLVYFSAHLGGAFVLSTIIGTPGCEMRALPHLWTLVTGRVTKEHYCPGPLDRLDKWETARHPV